MFGQKRIPSREGGVEIVVEELCTRMVAQGHNVTCYNRGGHHVSGSEYDSKRLSKGVQDYFEKTYGRKTVFIPNGVSHHIEREPQIIKNKFGLDKDKYILFLGRLVPEKGIKYLIEAFKQVDTDVLYPIQLQKM